MIAIGDIQIFVTDFDKALKFWAEGLGLDMVDQEQTPSSRFVVLEFPDGGPAIHLIGPVEAWEAGARPEPGTRPTVRFDITTTEFDDTLMRLLEAGGTQIDEIDTYNDLRVVTLADPDQNTFELIEVPEDWAEEGFDEDEEDDEDDEFESDDDEGEDDEE